MGRVGDGGGLRLEKEKEIGKETGIKAEPFFQDTDKEPSCACACNSGQEE